MRGNSVDGYAGDLRHEPGRRPGSESGEEDTSEGKVGVKKWEASTQYCETGVLLSDPV